MKHIVVTGGAGFIGGTFALMCRPDFKITVIDKLTYAAQKYRIWCAHNIELFEVDIADKEALLDVFKQIPPVDAIVHFAAETHVDNSISNPEVFVQSNIVGTYNIFEMLEPFSIPKCIYVSTDETIEHTKPMTYGYKINHEDGTVEEAKDPAIYFNRRTEKNGVFKPSSVYSASKASGEMLAMAYRKTNGCNITTVRLCNQYGPFQHKEKLIPKTIERIMKNERIPVFKTPAYRDWMFVQDGCTAIRKILDLKRPDDLYHISAYQETLAIDIVKMIIAEMGASEDLIELVEDRKGYDLVYSIDSEKLRQQTGWAPEWSLEEGIRLTVNHFKEKLGNVK